VLVRDLEGRIANEEHHSTQIARARFESEIRLTNARFRYDGALGQTLDNLTIQQRPGEWIALVGPTGAGKSTIVDLMLGVLSPDEGGLWLDGRLLETRGEREAWQRNCAYVPQTIFLVDDSVVANIAFGEGSGSIDFDRVRWAARVAQIDKFIEGELSKSYETVIGERGMRLSGGQRQRIGVARALYRQPKFLVLDEATSALDNATEQLFFEALRAELVDVSVVSIAHRLSTTRNFDRIYIIERGVVVDSGTYDELKVRSGHFSGVRT